MAAATTETPPAHPVPKKRVHLILPEDDGEKIRGKNPAFQSDDDDDEVISTDNESRSSNDSGNCDPSHDAKPMDTSEQTSTECNVSHNSGSTDPRMQ